MAAAKGGLGAQIALNMSAAIQAAMAEQMKAQTGAYIRAMGKAMINMVGDEDNFVKAHEVVANRAREAVLDSYDAKFSDHKEYRVGQGRLSGGVLRRALEEPSMFTGDARGINIGDRSILNKEAKHWYRLNYGTSGVAPLTPAVSPVLKFGGGTVTTLTDASPRSKPFHMPVGFWRDGEFHVGDIRAATRIGYGSARASLYATGDQKATRTKESNIAGRRFFDAGLVAITETLPEVYEDLLLQFADRANKEGKGALARAKVNVKHLFPGRY